MPVLSRTSPTGTYRKIGRVDANRAGFSKYWAPHLVKRGSSYFAFFSASRNGAKPCVYYASSTRVAGGYSAPRLLTCGGGSGREAIDASTFVTSEGNTYLVWRSGVHRLGFPRGDYDIIARRLSFSGGTAAFTAGSRNDNLLHRTSDHVYEAPSLVRHGGKVWLFVSRNRYDTNAYYTAVYSADTIHGTFTFRKNLMKTSQGYGYGPGGAEVETAADGDTYIAYHVWKDSKPTPQTPGKRILKTAKARLGERPAGRPLTRGATAQTRTRHTERPSVCRVRAFSAKRSVADSALARRADEPCGTWRARPGRTWAPGA